MEAQQVEILPSAVDQPEPEYFLVGFRSGAPLRIVSVHCKGSHAKTPYPQCDQLAKSSSNLTRFVLGDVDSGGGPPPGLMLATAICASGGIETRVLDPSGPGLLQIPGRGVPDLGGKPTQKNLFPEIPFHENGQKRWRPGFALPEKEWEWFSKVLARASVASVLTFVGDRKAAAGMLTENQHYRLGGEEEQEPTAFAGDTRINLGGVEFVGTDHVLRLCGTRVEVVAAMPEELRDLLAVNDYEGFESALPVVRRRLCSRKERVQRDWGGVMSFDSAGPLFAIRSIGGGKPLDDLVHPRSPSEKDARQD